ncbi:MAG: hypothetical protein LBB83_12095 [Treponema sp.]|nr:hypothetical protein [Treponema sp.]
MNHITVFSHTGRSSCYRFFRGLCFFLLTAILFLPSCRAEKPVNFSCAGFGKDTALLGLSGASAAGELRLSKKTETLRFRFEPPVNIGPGVSLEAEYYFRAGKDAGGTDQYRIIAAFGRDGDEWELPGEAAFLLGDEAATAPDAGLCYALPLAEGVISEFSIKALAPESGGPAAGSKTGAVWVLRSLKLIPRWYGFEISGENGARPMLKFTPYLTRDNAGSLVILPRPEYGFQDTPEIRLGGIEGDALITAGKTRLEYRPPRGTYPFSHRERSSASAELLIPSGALDGGIFPLTLSGANSAPVFSLTSLVVAPGPQRPFPREPVPADPELILSYPQENWRSPAYEVFRWPDFPGILILDTANYAVQERLFKRLAFFVEKRDYRGRLVPDQELAGLHGWNAHDYRAEDLAFFFETARLDNFPLLDEERGLYTLLLENGTLRREPEGKIVPGTGAVLSISRESSDYLRGRFMTHECFHGLFFIDEDFRNFSTGRWENFPPEAKRFFSSYLDSMRYDLAVSYLVVNEFMAYCSQQSVSQAPYYFGEYLAGQIAGNPLRRAVLPPEEQTANGGRYWPVLSRAFAREAEAFSDYAFRRWGFSAGAARSLHRE